MGKKHKYNDYLDFTVVRDWSTGEDSLLEDAEIEHEIYALMKKLMQSPLIEAPGHRENETDIALWKQYCIAYYNSRTDEWVRCFRCPMNYRCKWKKIQAARILRDA